MQCTVIIPSVVQIEMSLTHMHRFFGRNPKVLTDLESDLNVKVSGIYKEYKSYWIKVCNISWCYCLKLSMLNKERDVFQYKSEDLVYIISHLTSKLRTSSRKVLVKCEGL